MAKYRATVEMTYMYVFDMETEAVDADDIWREAEEKAIETIKLENNEKWDVVSCNDFRQVGD